MVVVVAIGWLVGIRAEWVAKVVAGWVSPKFRADGGENVRGNGAGVITVCFVEIFFYGVIDGVDGGFASFVASEGLKV